MSSDKLTADDLPAVLKAFEDSGWSSMTLRTEGLTLTLGSAAAAPPPAAAAPPAPEPESGTTGTVPDVPPEDTEDGTEGTGTGVPSREGLVAIPAPVMGSFYRAPSPGSPPYVEVGATVSPDDTVCIVEVMKLMNQVTAGVSGEVVEICATNGDMVQEDQALFYVKPS